MKKGLFALLLLGVVATESSADLPVTKYWELKQKDPFTVGIYVDGVGVGISWANVRLRTKKMPPLYCPPVNLAVTKENYMRILDDQLQSIGADRAIEGPIEMHLLNGLIETFPCPK